MSNKSFFAGMEEVLARICSLVLTLVFFLIFILTRGELEVEWRTLSVILLIFWLVYEILSLMFFNAFRYFSNNQEALKSNKTAIQVEPQVPTGIEESDFNQDQTKQ